MEEIGRRYEENHQEAAFEIKESEERLKKAVSEQRHLFAMKQKKVVSFTAKDLLVSQTA